MWKVETKSTLILILVTAIWGLTFPLIESAVVFINPASFVLIRMIIASISFLPLVYYYLNRSNKLVLLGGLLLACLNATAYLLQTKGLQTIPASRSAFITGFSVVLVPLLAPIFRLGIAKKIEIAAAMLCLVGLYILTGANLEHLSSGDFWSLGCAVSYSLFLLTMQVITKYTDETLLLSFYCSTFGIILPLLCSPKLQITEFLHWQVIIAVLFCALIATSVVNFLMLKFQKHIAVTRAVIIYALEPVFATTFAFLLYHQAISLETILGGVLIFISIILPSIKRRPLWQTA